MSTNDSTTLSFDADALPMILEQREIDALPWANYGVTLRRFVIEALNEHAPDGVSFAWGEGEEDFTSTLIDKAREIRASLRSAVEVWDPKLVGVIESDDAEMLGRPVLSYPDGEDMGRVAGAEDVLRTQRAGEVGAYECPVSGRSVYISR